MKALRMEQGICKVCELLDKDIRIKNISFCKQCNEYICFDCEPNLLRRGKAAFIQAIKNLKT